MSSSRVKHLEQLRFYVRSRSRFGVVHLVDLSENHPFGQCSCEWWSFQIGPNIKDLRKQRLRRYCPHIRLARDFLADQVIEGVLGPTKKTTKTP